MAPHLIPVVGPDQAQSSFFASGLGVRGFQVAGLGGSPRGQGDRLLYPLCLVRLLMPLPVAASMQHLADKFQVL